MRRIRANGAPFVRTIGSVRTLTEAFEAACQELDDTGQPELVLEVIADRIIAAARGGERDPVRLRAAALAGMPED